MPLFDLPLEQLKTYRSPDPAPKDFDAFWAGTLAEARRHPMLPSWETGQTLLKLVDSFDVTFPGFDGQLIKGWLTLPKERHGKLPVIVEYIGYGGGRAFATDWLFWPNLGYAHFVMDTRGQGSTWSHGDTPDNAGGTGQNHVPGFMTKGIEDPKTYYYRRVYTDAARAIEAVLSHPAIDPERIAVTGGSQGGGISIAAAGLMPQVKVVMPDVPFLCHFRRAVEMGGEMPYKEIAQYFSVHRHRMAAALHTLDYFDGVHFAERTKCKAFYSVGLMDGICPPSTVFAAFNAHHGMKEIKVWPFNQHEGGAAFQGQEKMRFMHNVWKV